jgi:hypothetical protein
MGTHSGKWAAVSGKSTVRNWTIEDRMALAKGYASNTAMGPVRKKGVRSWTGQFGFFGREPPEMPGELFGFVGYGAPDDDVSGTGQLYDGDAMVDSINQMWSWRDGQMLSGVVNFSGHLNLDIAEGAEVEDATAPDMEPVCGLIIEVDNGSGGYQEIPNLAQASLTISAANQSYSNSSTQVGGDCWTGRKAGPINMTLQLTQEDNERVENALQVGEEVAIKAWVNETEFWELLWLRVTGFSGIRADRETGAILAQTINLEMTAYGGSGALGNIIMPGGTIWWPF